MSYTPQLGFLHAPRSKDGTDNYSRRTNGVKRSADLPTDPVFREPKRIKKGAKKPQRKTPRYSFDSELKRLKSNKKPLPNTHIPFNCNH